MRTKLDNTFLKFFGDLSEITKQIKSKTINNAYITKHYTYMNIIFLLLMIKESNCTHSPMDGKFLRKRISERRKKMCFTWFVQYCYVATSLVFYDNGNAINYLQKL